MVALTARQQDSCPFFDKLPLEIRLLVYRELLVSEKTIVGLSMMVGKERLKRRMQSNYDPIPDIDAAILRTCRKAYNEAIDTLYGENLFKFSSIRTLNAFKEDGLTEKKGNSLPMRIAGTPAN
jgi:hypothetical protein